MTTVLPRLLMIGFILIASANANAEQATTQSVKQLMQATGAGDMGVAMMNQMLPALKQIIPDAPDTFWDDIMADVDGEEIENLVIPIYQKYLTEQDVQALNTFYQTDIGRKLIRVQPQILQESMQVGQQWGEQLAENVIQQYQEQASAGQEAAGADQQ